MKKSNKKGFTIIELVIVVAVIAVLSAVLIPTFNGVVEKANLSNDQSMVRQMNTTLATEAIPDGFEEPGDAILALNGCGFTGKYSAFSKDFHYAYNAKNNTMYLLDRNDNVVYPKDETVNKADLWGLYNNNPNNIMNGITQYIALSNITDNPHFQQAFSAPGYVLDLCGHYISVEENTNVTATNGVILSGPQMGEDTETGYTVLSATEFDAADDEGAKSLTFTKRIITEALNVRHQDGSVSYTFKDCLFYDGGCIVGDVTGNLATSIITIEDCQFIECTSWAVVLYQNAVVKNNEFINCKYGDIMLYDNDRDYAPHYVISGNVFSGIVADGRGYLRFCSVGADDYAFTAEISNNTFGELALAKGILELHSNLWDNITSDNYAAFMAGITFENNTLHESIEEDRIVYGDNLTGYKATVQDTFLADLKN